MTTSLQQQAPVLAAFPDMAKRLGRFVGIDVAKQQLDVHVTADDRSPAQSWSVPNTPAGFRQLIRRLRPLQPHLIVLEATGGYENRLMYTLLDASLPVVRVNPARVRHFAKSRGVFAKTDPIDARILAEFGQAYQARLHPVWPVSHNLRMLRELIARRRQLVEQRVTNKNQLEHVTLKEVEQSIRRTLTHLDAEIKAAERLIQERIDGDEELAARQKVMETVTGIGPQVSRVLVTEMPELGKIDRRAAAALVGVAPFNDDSGGRSNPRHIKGGRLTVRSALYMSALVASRRNPVIRAHYLHLLSNGKPKKVALVACMRKIINHLSSLLAENQTT